MADEVLGDDETVADPDEEDVVEEDNAGQDGDVAAAEEEPEESTPEGGDKGEQKEGVLKPSGRAANDFGRLRAENRALKESQESIRRELDDLRVAQQQRASIPDPMQERMRYEAMSEIERLQYDFNKGRQEDQYHRQRLEAQLWATSDKAEFQALCAASDKAAKRGERVEKEFQDRLRAGKAVDRGTILRWLIGDDVLRSKAVARQAANGRKNIARQRTTPVTGRGDASTERRSGKTAAERLEGVVF